MRTRFFIFNIVFFTCITLFSQKARLTMEEAVGMERTSLSPQGLKNLQWIPGSGVFSYIGTDPSLLMLWRSGEPKPDTLNLLGAMNKEVMKAGLDSLTKLPNVTWVDADKFRFKTKNILWKYQTTKGNLSKALHFPHDSTGAIEELKIHPKINVAAFLQNDELKFIDETGVVSIAKPEKEGIVIGKAVHRNEFGINEGIFLSNSGSKLAFYRMDESMVTQYPIYELDSMPAKTRLIRYPFAGSKSHEVTIGVWDKVTKKVIFLETGLPSDQYLTNIAWSKDDRTILVAHLNRDQNHLEMKSYDSNTGKLLRKLFEEKDSKYVEPEAPAHFIPNGKGNFLWESERFGTNQLFHYSLDGKFQGQVSKGDYIVTEFLGFNEDGTLGFFSAVDTTGLNKHTYYTDIKKGESFRIDPASGIHNGLPSPDGSYVLDIFSSERTPREVQLTDIKRSWNKKSIFRSNNPLEKYDLGRSQLISVRSKDNRQLNGRLIYPLDFDPSKKYPVIVYVYGGPHAQMVTNNWLHGANLWMHKLAGEGFFIWTLDNRGSDHRGLSFESATFRNLGTIEIEDQMAGIKYLKSQDFIDTSRIGVDGWSYGGFMTTSLMTRQPETFKVGVAGGPVIDWKMYEIMYTERYMDTPFSNPEGYANSSTFKYISNLKGRLMLIHGVDDDVVLWQNSLLYLRESTKAGKLVDYMAYPGHLHNVQGKDRIHLFKKIEQYFKDHL
jgi:dipeptidyl-peptidase 4